MSLILKSIILKGLIIIFMINYAWAADTSYYVDATRGSDSHTGLSHAQAWKTLSKVNNSKFNTGDNVYLLCGETWNKQNLNVDWSGTDTDRAVIGAYYMKNAVETVGVNGDGKPIIDGETTHPSATTSALVTIANDITYVTIQDLDVRNANGGGIKAARADYVIVQRCKVDWTLGFQISFYRSDYGEAYYNEVSRGSQSRPLGGTWHGAIGMRKANYGIMMYNYVHDHYGEGLQVGNYGICKYNLVVDTASIGIYLDARSNAEISYNMVVGTNDTTYVLPKTEWHNSGIAIGIEVNQAAPCENNKVHHNIIINTYAGIRMRDSDLNPGFDIDNIYIYNNTFIDNRNTFHITSAGEIDGSNVYVKNNISYTKHDDSNHWLITGGTISSWDVSDNVWAIDSVSPNGSFPGKNYKTGDPNFKKKNWRSDSFMMSSFSTSDLFIGDGSSAKDNGVDSGSAYRNLIAHGSSFHTNDPDPNHGNPISVFTVKQEDDNPLWDIGATSTGASTGGAFGAPLNLRVIAALHQ